MYLRGLLILFCFYAFNANAEPVSISDFDHLSLANWQHKSFQGATQYQLKTRDQTTILQASSNNSASSLYQEISIDLNKTPYLNWSWRIEKRLDIANEKIKPGDDFAARIYLIVKGEWFFWQTKAINYVWAGRSTHNEVWANPFAGENVMMIAVRSNADQTDQWYTEKRNVLADMTRYFGDNIHKIDGIAIMTDTDNSGATALSYYNDIYFSEN